MNNTIHIPEACSEKWAIMKDAGNKLRHCDVCKLNVHDFSNDSLSDINRKLRSADGKKVCGNYHERHTTNTKPVYVLTNAIDNTFSKTKLKRFSLLIISMILLFAGCARRRTMGAYAFWGENQKIKKPHVEQVKTKI